jgi:hypothetical protein
MNRRRSLAVLVAFALLALGAAPAFGAKGGGGKGGGHGTTTVTIQFASSTLQPAALTAGDQVTFAVTEPSTMSIWVANKCYKDGALVYSEYQGVVDNSAGPFTLDSDTGGAQCTAYAWAYPDLYTPLASLSYSVS